MSTTQGAPQHAPKPDDPAPYLMPKAPPPAPSPYPKHLWHAVHGEITVPDQETEARIMDRQSWFATPEEADAHRTADEAWLVQAASLQAKLHKLTEGKPPSRVVLESNQSAAAAQAAAGADAAGTVSYLGGASAGTPGSTTGHAGVTPGAKS